MKLICLISVSLILLPGGCRTERGKETVRAAVTGNRILIASRVAIEDKKDCKRISIIDPWQGAENVKMEYYLVKRGQDIPEGLDPERVILVPVRRIICMSTTHIAMIQALGMGKTIVGMSGPGFIYSAALRLRADSGFIKDVGYEANLNKELIMNLSPDIIMIYGIGSESSGYVGKLRELGMKVIYNADYLEIDPLAKTEWIKLFGALYCRENEADSIFNAERIAYSDLRSYISGHINSRPKVMLGLPFKDTWFISPGNSYISQIIEDAGGEYLWKDTHSPVSMPLGLENVWLRAVGADYWLNIGTVTTKGEISSVDMRLNELRCFIDGNLYNNNKRLSPGGGNDFWESGSVNPHLILHDVASIIHPGLFDDKKLTYYRRIL